MVKHGLRTQFVCEPMYSLSGRMMALEVLTRFISECNKTLSYMDVQSLLTTEDKWSNFLRQIRSILLWKDYFLQHQLIVTVNVDSEIVERLLREPTYLKVLSISSFINFEVNEDFPHSSRCCENSLLCRLLPYTRLWLDDVGSGRKNNFNCLTKGVFRAAKIDKAYLWQHQNAEETDRLANTIRDLSRYADVVVVEGVENNEHVRRLAPFSHCWLQGYLFKSCDIENFKTLPLYIDPLGY